MSKELSLDNLGRRTKQVIEYFISNPTKTQDEIAVSFGLSRSRVSQILNNRRVQKLYPILIRRHYSSTVLAKAGKRYEELIEHGKNEATVEKAAGTVLKSNGVLSNEGMTVDVKAEITLKNVRELSKIISDAQILPKPYFDTEIVSTEPDKPA